MTRKSDREPNFVPSLDTDTHVHKLFQRELQGVYTLIGCDVDVRPITFPNREVNATGQGGAKEHFFQHFLSFFWVHVNKDERDTVVM